MVPASYATRGWRGGGGSSICSWSRFSFHSFHTSTPFIQVTALADAWRLLLSYLDTYSDCPLPSLTLQCCFNVCPIRVFYRHPVFIPCPCMCATFPVFSSDVLSKCTVRNGTLLPYPLLMWPASGELSCSPGKSHPHHFHRYPVPCPALDHPRYSAMSSDSSPCLSYM